MTQTAGEGSRLTRSQSKQATVRKVMDAAGALFAARGYHATTVRDIADRAGLSIGSVMAVGDKQALFVRIFDDIIGDIHGARKDSGAIPGDARGVVDRMAALVEPFISLFLGRLDLSREYGAVLMRGAHDSILFSDLAAALMKEIAAEAAAIGFSADEARAAAKTVYLAYLGTLFAAAARGGTPDPHPQDELVSVLEYVFAPRKMSHDPTA